MPHSQSDRSMCFTNCLSSSRWDEQPIKELQILVEFLTILDDWLHIRSEIYSSANDKTIALRHCEGLSTPPIMMPVSHLIHS